MDPPPDLLPARSFVFRKLWFALIRFRSRLMFCPSSPLVDMSSWMQQLPPDARKQPISSLMIPGSHDAGSYGLTTDYGFAPDQSELEQEWWFRYFPRIALTVSKRWTVTQAVTVKQQLRHGIRYLDLRGAPILFKDSSQQEKDLFFVHALYGPSLIQIAQDVKKFVDSHPGEVIILHFQHFHAVSKSLEAHFFDQLRKIFGSKLCPYSDKEVSPSLDQLTSKGHQVMLFFPDDSSVSSEFLWPSDRLPNPWANTTDEKELTSFLKQKISERKSDRLFVTQCVLTPDHSFIQKHFFRTLRKSLAQKCNETISNFLNEFSPGPSGPNIVMTDFIEWNDYKLPRQIVMKNFNR